VPIKTVFYRNGIFIHGDQLYFTILPADGQRTAIKNRQKKEKKQNTY
jgi:hypothetical protein